MILLDTDAMIDLLRQHPPALAWLASNTEEIGLPGYVVMELIQGCKNKAEQEKVEHTFSAYAIAWASPQVCDEALAVFARSYLSHNIGILDTLIGQLAASTHTVLYTFNQKHYAAIPNLKMVQPYER